MSVPYLAQAADHEQLEWLGGGTMRVLLDGDKTDGGLTVVRTAAAGGSAAPVHVHANEDEIFVPPLTADQMIPAFYLTRQTPSRQGS